MVFKASKERKRKEADPVGIGSPMIPPAPVRAWYRGQMDQVCAAMVEDYRAAIKDALKNPNVERAFATDASPNSVFQKVLDKLNSKWSDIFRGFAKSTSKKFVDKSDDHSKASTVFSLSTAGIEQPVIKYSENVANTLQAAQDFNNTLITGIQAEVHEKIYNSVMLSLTSPNPEEQGQSGIEASLREIGGFAKDRSKLIARDQTSKLYSALADERMEQNGVDEFEWMHSSAGKVPRQSHVDKDGMIFKINDPRLWEGKMSDQGPPGWAINCRCRRRPIIR
jgi:uncharacterized protein with gpF-like domain